MAPNLTNLYHTFYETYSKKYGQNTCILLLVGKFYELYDFIHSETGEPCTSMRRAIELMNIAMKEKPNHGPKGEMGLWSGFPEQSLHKFSQTLTKEGWTVVVVDQVKNFAEQVIDRVATRILSPGTHVEMATQERMTVAAIWTVSTASFAASVLDLTTGEVFSYETDKADNILHMLQVYNSREVIITQATGDQLTIPVLKSMFGIHGIVYTVPYDPQDNFEGEFPREEYLRKMFRLKTLLPVRTALNLPLPSLKKSLIERSLCLLLRFVEDHFPSIPSGSIPPGSIPPGSMPRGQEQERLTSHSIYCPSFHMRLSNNILEQLNMITFNNQKSILSMLEWTHSAIGKRALRERILRPITQDHELQKRWGQIAWILNLPLEKVRGLEHNCKALYDLPRLHYKFAEGSLEALDILQMFQTYAATTCLIQNLNKTPLEINQDLEKQIQEFRQEVRKLLDEEKAQKRDEGENTGFLTPTAGPLTFIIEQRIQESLKSWNDKWQKFCTSVKIPVDSFYLEKKNDGDYSWEGSRTHLKVLKAEYFLNKNLTSGLTGMQFDSKKSGPIIFSCNEFTEFSNILRALTYELSTTLKRESQAVCDTLWEKVRTFQASWIEWLGNADCSLALAAVAREQKWVQPSLGKHLHIEGLRHPLLESSQTRMEYVKHSVSLGSVQKERGWLIYGVNASGKSSLMKATGIAVLLAQAGSFVPADSMVLRPYESAFSRIWTHDNVWAGLSSFAVEIAELRDILTSATDRSLVLGDEVCSGTESMSATALVASTLEHLDEVGAHFMFATHLHDLIKVPKFMPRPGIAVWHLRVQRTPEGKLIYDRTLQPGSGSCTYGLEVARAMGIPLPLLSRAHEIRRALSGEVTGSDAPKSSWNTKIQRQVCEVCGSATVKDLEVHHIVQRSEGGGNNLRNLVVLCESCHDSHHAGELEVPVLVMTTDGLERSTKEKDVTTASVKAKAKDRFTEEEQESISNVLKTFQGRPLLRASLALEEQGIHITAAQLAKF